MELEQEQELENTPSKTVNQDIILQAALKLFAERGYFNTSLSDIKEAVGLKSSSSLQQFFKTKQAIAVSLRENMLDSFSISIDDIRRRNRKPSEQLREIVDLLFRLTEEAPEIIHFMLFSNPQEMAPGQMALHEAPAFIKIKKILQIGVKEGEIRNIDTQLAYCYFFGIIQQALWMLLSKELPKTADSYQVQIWQAAWNSIAKK